MDGLLAARYGAMRSAAMLMSGLLVGGWLGRAHWDLELEFLVLFSFFFSPCVLRPRPPLCCVSLLRVGFCYCCSQFALLLESD